MWNQDLLVIWVHTVMLYYTYITDPSGWRGTTNVATQNNDFIFSDFWAQMIIFLKTAASLWFEIYWNPTTETLRIVLCFKKFDYDGFVGLQSETVERCGPKTIHPCAGYKQPGIRQARGPGRIQALRLKPEVEQNKEVDTTPGAQKGKNWGR